MMFVGPVVCALGAKTPQMLKLLASTEQLPCSLPLSGTTL